MSIFKIRLACEAGISTTTGARLSPVEETVVVDAPSEWEARAVALRVTSIRALGRLVRFVNDETGEEIVSPSPAALLPGYFVIDGLPGNYHGFTRGETWNGWAVPYFPLTEAQRIASDYAAQPVGPDGQPRSEYDAGRGLIRLYDPSSDEWDEYGSIAVDGQTFYPVGSHYWTWEQIAMSSGQSGEQPAG